MASKVQMTKFNKKVEKIVLALGGVVATSYKWSIETKAGTLFVTVHEPEASKLFSIFCRFDNPQLANENLPQSCKGNLNENSGKWNYHFMEEEYCLQLFSSRLKEIESVTELANLYDLRITFLYNLSLEEKIAREIRDCFNRHKGKLKKALMDETIKAVGARTPEYKKVWKDFKKTFEIKTKGGEYINPFYVE